MRLPLAARLTSPAARTSLFYSTLFVTPAISTPFLPIWLSEKGISPAEIGFINALPLLIMVVLNLVVGRLADRASDWRSVIVAGSLLACFGPIVLLFVDGFWPILIAWTLLVVPFQAIAPVVDAAAFRMTRRTGDDFGLIRMWGTIGFIVVTIISGFVLDWWGALVFVPLMLVAALSRGSASLALPLFRGGEERTGLTHPIDAPVNPMIAIRMGELWRPWFILPLIGAALLQGSHMMQMGFGALLWREQGLPGWMIGLLWAVAPLGEVIVMFQFEKITRRFPARYLLLAGCACGIVRWAGFAMSPTIPVLIGLQFLHMATVGLAFVGIVNFIGNWTSSEIAAEAQSFFTMLRQVSTVLAFAVFGYLTAAFGAGAFYFAAVLSLAGGVLIVISLLMMSPRRERSSLAQA
ncbi:MAG: putative 3-phenylpropionic acid transporter [Devosia sp.]|nr:putative 3-phenylpropionic acid transporter [Devosia sp.]